LPEPTAEDSEARQAGFSTISELSRGRINAAAERTKQIVESQLSDENSVLDVGYRTYKLVDTNFSKWRVTSDIEPNVLEQHLLSLRDSSDDDATPDDLLTELLLKQGYSLVENISDYELSGLKLKSVGQQLLLAYLNEHEKPTLDQLRSVVDAEPAKFLILEDVFHGDDELKTNLVQMCKTKSVELWTA
jgi:adenine-specific DNA-methyltransferase